ncbi:MAG: hypothetical protein ACRDQA_12900, partial [Nocardioidaceae bacterium]
PVATTSANYSTQYLQNINADINLRSVGWCSDWPSGGSWFRPEFYSTDLSKEGFGSNFSGFSHKNIDNKIDSIERMPLEKQPDAWNQLDRTIMKKYYPVITTFNPSSAMMRGSKVHGMGVNNIVGMPTWKQMWVG